MFQETPQGYKIGLMEPTANKIKEILLSQSTEQEKLKLINHLLSRKNAIFFFREFIILWKSFSYDALIDSFKEEPSLIKFRVLEAFASTIRLPTLISPWPSNDREREAAAQELEVEIRLYIANKKAMFFAGSAFVLAAISTFISIFTLIF